MASAIGTRKIPGARVCRGRDAKGGGRRSSLSLAQVQASGTMETVHLGYWRIRALGEPIRLICEVGQLPYEEHSYQVKWDDERGWHADEWFNEDKPKMKENNWFASVNVNAVPALQSLAPLRRDFFPFWLFVRAPASGHSQTCHGSSTGMFASARSWPSPTTYQPSATSALIPRSSNPR